jgi:hypothetical protein
LIFSIDSVKTFAKKTEEQITTISKNCNIFTNKKDMENCKGVFINAYHVLHIMDEQLKKTPIVAPDASKYKYELQIIKNSELKDVDGQADAADFLSYLLLTYLIKDTDISESICFDTSSITLCSDDNRIIYQNPNIVVDSCLSLLTVGDSIQECINFHFTPINLDINTDIKTQTYKQQQDLEDESKCKKEKMLVKPVIDIHDKQKYLIIILKRYSQDGTKIDKKINVDEQITINKDTRFGKTVNFKLRGVICHLGSSKGGHYVYISIENDKKILYNDDQPPTFFKNNIDMTKLGYIFLYERIQETALLVAGGSNTIPPKSKPNPIPISKSTIKITSNKKPNKRTRTRKHENKITHKLKENNSKNKNKKKTRKHIHKNTVIAK